MHQANRRPPAESNRHASRPPRQPVPDTAWKTLFNSEGYVRLKKRELSMSRPFDEETFRKFVMSDELLAKQEVMYVEDIPREEFEATIAHEMHHIGYGTACKDDDKPLPELRGGRVVLRSGARR